MKKAMTVFVFAAFVVVAVVMFFYWQQEAEAVTKGVLVSSQIKVEKII